jgi:hypothetical protein
MEFDNMKSRYRQIRKMTPRDGVRYATEYYKQSPGEYTKLYEHVQQTIVEVVRAAQAYGIDLDVPLTGFPRTSKRPNYSAMDIMQDMLTQMDQERDVPSGMLGRWNRLFDANEDMQILMEEQSVPNPVFNKLFY